MSIIIGALLAPVLCAAVIWSFGEKRVSRARLERFARREALPITSTNGNLVIRYLAVTRRWRSVGLLVAVLVAIAFSLRDNQLSVSLLAALGGWFAGAVLAELRVANVETSGPRQASLQPRLLRERLRPAARLLPVLMLFTIVLVSAVLLVQDPALEVLGFFALGVAEFAVTLAAGRYVLQRPQPSNLALDVRAADDARRDRSLHALAGSAIALLGYPLGQLLTLFDGRAGSGPGTGTGTVVALLALVAGWWVATTARSRRRLRTAGGTRAGDSTEVASQL